MHPTGMRTSQPRSRNGFTLLELLISLGLLILLTSAIAASLFLFMRTETSGRGRVERSQIVRAIYFRMTNDLRCVTFQEQIKEDSDEEGVTAAEDESQSQADNTFVELTSPDDAYGNRSDGLYGNSTTLVIYTSRPPRAQPKLSVSEGLSDELDNFSWESEGYYSGSGFRAVSWFLAGESTSGLAASVDSSQTDELGELSGGKGLARMDGDALDIMFSASEMGLLDQSGTGRTQVLAPEVISLAFRYFDGVDWTDAWDSRAMERLPNAVEVTLGLRTIEDVKPEDDLLIDAVPEESEGNTVRFVIALQVAPAPLTEVQL